jgi:prephenate dehydrogenase
MHVALLGFGLIGGSLARALLERDPARWTIAAWSPSGEGPRAAESDGTIDRAATSPEDAAEGADLIVLAAPPLACLALLDRLAAIALPRAAVVTDVASTKRRLVERAAALGLPFVGGHPMAGRESTGYGAAQADLFVDRPWVVVPAEGADRVETLARATGARPLRMSADEHDAAVAAISHLPLVLAAALVEAVAGSPDWDVSRRLAASGWRDMTRLARGDVEMGAGIAATNADELVRRLRAVRDVVDDWLHDLDAANPDPDTLRRRLAAARALLEAPE